MERNRWKKVTTSVVTLFLLVLSVSAGMVTVRPTTAHADVQVPGWEWNTDCPTPPPSCDPKVTTVTNQTTGASKGAVRFNTFYRNVTSTSKTSSGTTYELYCAARGSLYEAKASSATGASPTIAPSGTMTRPSASGGSSGLTCPGDNLYPRRLVVLNTWSGESQQTVLEKYFGTSGSSTGTGSSGCNFGTVRASYIDGEFRIYFAITPPAPSQGWEVFVPDPGNGATNVYPVLQISAVMVTGATNWYGGRIDMPPPTDYTYRLQVKGNPNCYKIGPVSLTELAVADYGDATSGEDAEYGCNGWNPLNYLKCLFIPKTLGQQWSELTDTAKTRPPLSIIVGGVSWMQFFYNMFKEDYETEAWRASWACDSDGDGQGDGNCGAGVLDVKYDRDNPSHRIKFDLLGYAANFMATNPTAIWFNRFVGIVFWFAFFVWAWDRIGSSFGSRG